MRILVIDDEAALREICGRVLRSAGYAVEIVSSGREVILRLSEEWDIVITDIHMPGGLGGLEVLERVKQSGGADRPGRARGRSGGLGGAPEGFPG